MKKNIAIDFCNYGYMQEYEYMSFDKFKESIKSRNIIRLFFSFRDVIFLVEKLATLSHPLVFLLFAKLLSTGDTYVLEKSGTKIKVTYIYLLRLFGSLIYEFFYKQIEIHKVLRDIENTKLNNNCTNIGNLNLKNRPLYLRTDLCYGIKSGGSIGHIAGVLNNFKKYNPIFYSTDNIPTVDYSIEKKIIFPDLKYRNYSEMSSLYFNKTFYERILLDLKEETPAFIYQRYSINNYAGVKLSQKYKIPLIIEYNGSEVWIINQWNKRRLKLEAISQEIELLNLQKANLIIVVSQVLKDQLINLGIEDKKVFVNPNGVDPDKYSPTVDGSIIRRKYSIQSDTIIIGFIGTFGAWHGAEKLAEAFVNLINKDKNYTKKLRLLLIGDGIKMKEVSSIIRSAGVEDLCILTGTIPQEYGPEYLAACDILVSPHVPNPDNTPFFGSPTKLFEYMAMGKGIVASNLYQIGEILTHKETAFMVKPGDIDDLVLGLEELINNKPLREYLGHNARREVLKNYTWEIHANKIISKINEICEV